MRPSHMTACAAALAALIFGALPLAAQSSLGITSARLALGDSDTASEGPSAGLMVDVAVTQYHGLQFNLDYDHLRTGHVGRIGGAAYMTPKDGQKYGLTLMLADVNGLALSYGQIGAAGILALGEDFDLELRAGLGRASFRGIDWISAGTGLHWDLRPELQLSLHYDITDIEERRLDIKAHVAALGLTYSPDGQPWGLYAELARERLSGPQGGPDDIVLRLGATLALGAGGERPAFRLHDPIRQFLRRGLR